MVAKCCCLKRHIEIVFVADLKCSNSIYITRKRHQVQSGKGQLIFKTRNTSRDCLLPEILPIERLLLHTQKYMWPYIHRAFVQNIEGGMLSGTLLNLRNRVN